MLANAPFAVQEVAGMELDDETDAERMEPYIENVRYVHFEAAKIKECLGDWRTEVLVSGKNKLAEPARDMSVLARS